VHQGAASRLAARHTLVAHMPHRATFSKALQCTADDIMPDRKHSVIASRHVANYTNSPSSFHMNPDAALRSCVCTPC
jgi:hypothetical protein